MKPGFSWSRVLAGAETRQLQGRVGVGSQSCPVEEEKDVVEDCEHSWLSWTNPVITLAVSVCIMCCCAWTTVQCNVIFLFPLLFVNLTLDLVRSFSVLVKSPFLISSKLVWNFVFGTALLCPLVDFYISYQAMAFARFLINTNSTKKEVYS